MQIHHIPFDDVPYFSERDLAYTTQTPSLKPFYQYPVSIDAFPQIIEDKKKDNTDRELLYRTLKKQYNQLFPGEHPPHGIELLLKENTFTITTAHQPSLFTGPLYFIYKIISAIQLSNDLNERFPDYNFVPVYIIGGEDHDFEEINHLNLFNKKLVWENNESGAVGAMKTSTLSTVLAELKEILGDAPKAQEIYSHIEHCFTKYETYGEATLAMVHHLFGQEGLVILDMNQPELKRAFIPHSKKELFENASLPLVESAVWELESIGFKKQATPREINFFYLKDQFRERIEKEDGKFYILNTNLQFTEEEMMAELEEHPERFSPNVVMRPIYQEFILPNLAYIGGGGEIAYWLERKKQFEAFGLNFPMLIRRHSVLWVDKGSHKKMDKLGLSIQDLLEKDVELIIKRFVKNEADEPLSLKHEKKALNDLFERVKELAVQVDPTLGKTVMAEKANQIKSLSQLEGRLIKAEKQKHETAINQIRNLKDRLFPNNGLQERHDNFLSLYVRHGRAFFEELKRGFKPLENRLVVIYEH